MAVNRTEEMARPTQKWQYRCMHGGAYIWNRHFRPGSGGNSCTFSVSILPPNLDYASATQPQILILCIVQATVSFPTLLDYMIEVKQAEAYTHMEWPW